MLGYLSASPRSGFSSTGRIIWSASIPGRNPSISWPTAYAGGVLVGHDGNFVNFNDIGQQVWSSPTIVNGWVTGGSALAGLDPSNQKFLVTWTETNGSPLSPAQLSMIDLATGSIDWTTQLEPHGFTNSSPIVVGDKIFVYTDDARLKPV